MSMGTELSQARERAGLHAEQVGLDAFDSEEVLTRQAGTPLTIAPHETRHDSASPAHGLSRFALPVVSVLAAVGWGAYLYQTTRPFDRDTTPHIAAFAPRLAGQNDIATPDAATTRPQNRPHDQTIASSDRTSSADADRSPASVANTDAVPPAGTAPTAPESAGTAGSVRDVSGSWTLATHLESSTSVPFAGLHLGYEIQLEQADDRVTGTGRKVSENGAGIGSGAQTPISVAGTIDGDRLTLTFTEPGAQPPTQGKFVLLLEEGGTLRGRFSSNAAQSSGTVEAHRLPE